MGRLIFTNGDIIPIDRDTARSLGSRVYSTADWDDEDATFYVSAFSTDLEVRRMLGEEEK
jgi:hypothetical protein